MSRLIDITNKTIGLWTVIERVKIDKPHTHWLCKCKCGTIRIVDGDELRTGRSNSCGCVRNKESSKRMNTHGLSDTRIYNIWTDVKKRCYNKRNKEFHNYGGRGISVCEAWKHNFIDFYNWAMDNGYSDDLTIDRMDVNGNYEPSNCRWATWSEQGRNKRISNRNKTGISGIMLKRGKYNVRIGVNGKRFYIGDFVSFDDAVKARKEAEKKYWGGDAHAC
jgi:hypothetical protein